MEQDSNPNGLCKNGCGFYGTHSFEGMCSKCYKDLVKRQQQHPSPSAGRRSPGSCGAPLSALPVTQTAAAVTAAASVNEPTPNIDFASAVVTRSQEKVDSFASESDSSATDSSSSLSLDDVTDASPGKSKRNRCYSCRKKVGLTGFECRCGGLFCGIHRYSDKHNCTYDYKSDAREQIAKANPVVVGEKVKKI